MTARAIAYPGSFGDSTLPRISLGYAPPLSAALYDWAADGLPLGEIKNWNSSVEGPAFVADVGNPIVVDSGGSRAVRFDGVDDRMRVPFALSSPYTLVTVFRVITKIPNSAVLYGYASAEEGSLQSDGLGDFIGGYVAGTYLAPNPRATVDANWHVGILSVNGANSATRVDEKEVLGTLPESTRAGMTLGYALSGVNRTNIEYKRVAVLAGGATADQRTALVNQLSARYGI